MANKTKKFNDTDRDLKDVIEVDVDRKSTRLNSSHITISYAVFCLKKKKQQRRKKKKTNIDNLTV